jgi:hypothetical protein
MAPQIDLGVPPLTELRRKRSEKWEGYEPGVISATIAEMDFQLAIRWRRCCMPQWGAMTSATRQHRSRGWPRPSPLSPPGASVGRSILIR